MLIVLVQIDNRAYTDGASQSIQDFDSAPCIYMFSVHAVLAGNATSEMELIEVGYHGAGQSIRDFDSAIAYIFSVQAVLAGDATSEGHFDPSLHRSSGHRGSEPFSHRRDSWRARRSGTGSKKKPTKPVRAWLVIRSSDYWKKKDCIEFLRILTQPLQQGDLDSLLSALCKSIYWV